jgi:hypothetical protein
MKHLSINKTILALFVLSLFAFSSCKDDDVITPEDPNEEELITSVELTFTCVFDSSIVKTFKFADPDGDGGEAPTQTDTISLNANTNYYLAVRFLDESTLNVEDITEEVQEEADEHMVCYTTDAGTSLTITDKDNNGLDLGLAALVATSEAATGTFSISLKHQPDVKDGSCNVGETDVEVDFVLKVE